MTCDKLENLGKLMAAGDELAFRSIFDHFWPKIYKVSLTFCKSAEMAEEITQDIFVKIWLERLRFANLQNTEAYLFTIARNHIYNCLRKKVTAFSSEVSISELAKSEVSCPEKQLIFKESLELIQTVVSELPAQQRKVFYLSRNMGYSHEKIAEELQLSKQTVRSHMKLALRRIRIRLHVNAPFLMFLLHLNTLFSE
jgi:RNA polymerase sigma-70 factor (family 1)